VAKLPFRRNEVSPNPHGNGRFGSPFRGLFNMSKRSLNHIFRGASIAPFAVVQPLTNERPRCAPAADIGLRAETISRRDENRAFGPTLTLGGGDRAASLEGQEVQKSETNIGRMRSNAVPIQYRAATIAMLRAT
jgi:hypothetical protein